MNTSVQRTRMHGWRFGLAGVAVVALALAAMLGGSETPIGAQQPSATPTPTVIARPGAWQLTDPSFTALPGAKAYFGVLDRSTYHIELPDNWNGELVMYAHGYAGEGPLLQAGISPIRKHLIDLGFAWAASSYDENGYDPDLGVTDTLALRDYFIATFGKPKRTYLEGTSMSGHIVVSSLEQHPGIYDGALAECGVLMQEQEIDYLEAYSALADFISGVNALPAADAAAFQGTLTNQIVPALGTPDDWTPLGQAFESAVKYLTGGARPFRHEGMVDFYTGAFAAITQQQPASLAGLAATDDYFTFHIDPDLGFTDDQLNSGVLRTAADPAYRNAQTNPVFALPTGKITVPLLTYHTTGDNFVPLLHEINYRKTVDAAGNGDLLVQRTVRAPKHCQFDTADLVQGFDDLIAWVEHGVKPRGEDLLQADLTGLGREWTHHVLPGDDQGY
ncbi:MAG TPA: DUF6351 family protein [Dehalococcoidia bacterium]|nr:DUF6351 family protein [Dehalococcoidia bacterium]